MPESVDLPTLKVWLAQAELGYHTLMTKGGMARIREGEKWIEYHQADALKLLAYIQQLKSRIAAAGGAADLTGGRKRATRVQFG